MVSATAFQTKLALYTSYVVGGRVPRDTVPDALFWDTNRSLSLPESRNSSRLTI